MLKRTGAHGAGAWSVPGGHLEYGESFAETANREVLEEAGIKIKNLRFGAVTNDHFKEEDKHYITVWMLSDYESGEATILEPTKCSDIGWFDFASLPAPLFLPWTELLKSEFIEQIKNKAQN